LWIWALFTIIPWALNLLAAVPYLFYDLRGEKLEKIRSEMAERRARLSKEVSGGDGNE